MSKLKLARTLFLAAVGISFLLSVDLWFGGQKEQGVFVGLWVPTIPALGAMTLSGREIR
ncbi:MAG: hypothetical protein ACYSWT_10095 [Planctomycetota bacterium]|jgi:hypothetical protein